MINSVEVSENLDDKEKQKRRVILSLLFCFATILCWGLGLFLVNWRASLDEHTTKHPEQPLAVSIILACLGNLISTIILIVVWPWRPFELIERNAVFWSWFTGVLISFGESLYIVTADLGLPAVIGGPASSFHFLIPPLWYWLYDRKCITMKTALGFALSIASIILFSGLLCESISYTVTASEWIVLAMLALAWGISIITQANAVTGIKFQQFPQIQIYYAVGYTCTSIVWACASSISDVFDPSSYIPFGVDQYLAMSSVFCTGSGTGFFFVCLSYTDDASLMVALSSLSITVPSILGILILHEQATWNVILGLILSLAAMILLSAEANEENENANASSRDDSISWAMATLKHKAMEIPRRESYVTLP